MIEDLLSPLRREGVHIWSENGRVRYRAPKGVMTPERIAAIRSHQHEITAFLEEAQSQATELPPVTPAAATGAPPLSFAQERLWFLEQLGLAESSYNIAATIRLQGMLDVNALELAFTEVICRHQCLRTRFETEDGRGLQVIDQPQPYRLARLDLSHLSEDEQDAAASRASRDHAAQRFDLSAAAPFRSCLIQLAPEHHLLLLAMHHIISDAWSSEVLISEIGALYGAFRAGRPSPLEPLPVQYADYALWQRQPLYGAVLERQLAYWTQRLSAAPPNLELPTDRPRRALPSFAGATHWFSISEGVASALRALGQRENATLFMVLLSAFQLLLSRYCGQTDIAIGSPVAGRRRHELQNLIGLFANILVLRADCSGNQSFRDLLRQVRTTALDAYAHQDLPFEKLVEALQPDRDVARHPLVQVMFALQPAPFEALALPGLKLTPMAAENAQTKFDLTLHVYDTKSSLDVSIEYAAELFDHSTIDRLIGHLIRLLDQVVSDPDRRLSEITLLDESERRQQISDWNDTARSYPRQRCLHEMFAEQAARTPAAAAVDDGTRVISYRALDGWADGIAAGLRALGIRPGAAVGLSGERSADLIAGMLGILKAGGCYVPLDPGYPAERLAFMVKDAGLSAVVVAPGGVAPAGLPSLRSDAVHAADGCPPAASGGEAVAYIMYTSGSTGVPKGIAVPHRAVARLVLGTDYISLAPGDRLAHLASPSFDAATFELWGALLNGGTVVIIDRDTALSSAAFAANLRARHVSSLFVTTALFNRLVQDVPDIFASVRDVLFGGEAADPQAVRAVLGNGAPQRLLHVYGPTEATTFSTWLETRAVAADARTVPIGGPIANSTCYVLDAALQPVPIGVAGELYLGGDGLAHGYWGRPALTAERFIPDPFGPPGRRLYGTGDLVRRLGDGSIAYLTRRDGQVKIRGFRIELGEIEVALRAHAGVEQAVVVAHEDAAGKRLVAYVVATANGMPNAAELQHHLKRSLPDYMVPAAFVMLDQLPLTPNGKLDRGALPAPQAVDSTDAHAAPGNAVQEMLSAIWCDVLGVERPGIDDNFFTSGGHSLIAARLMARLGDVFKIELPLRALFQAPTIRTLAAKIEQAQREQNDLVLPPLVGRPHPLSLPLSYAQEPLWFLDQIGLVGAAYNMAGTLRLEGSLDVAALERSFVEIVHRHENLRTRFELVDGHGVQVIEASAGFGLELVDLSVLEDEERQIEARRLASEHAERPFNLRTGPLLRAMLVRLSGSEHLLMINMHHITSDGWSLRVLLRELGMLYAAHLEGRPSPLPDLSAQYADYTLWQRAWLDGDVLARHIAYWRHQLAGAPTTLDLPTDRPRPPLQSFAGATARFFVSSALSSRLIALSRSEGATLYMLFLAAFSLLLSRHSGQDDILIGSPVAGRSRPELEDLTGMFVNMLVIRSDLAGDPTFRELLGRVKETALDAYAHQDLPFEKLVDALQPERDLSRQPLFQASLSFENIPFEALALPGITASRIETSAEHVTTKFDLTLFAHETPAGIEGCVEYATDLFDRGTIDRLIGHLIRLLDQVVSDPDCRLSAITLLSAAERRQQISDWNDTARSYPRQRCLHEMFAEQAARTPAAAAVDDGTRVISYRALDGWADGIAAGLRALGIRPGAAVGLSGERSADLIAGMLGILKAGGCYVPLDPGYPAERLAFMVKDAGLSAVVVAPGGVAPAGLPSLRSDAVHAADGRPPAASGGEAVAYIMYTSGSTGVPKGIAVPHRAVARLVLGTDYISLAPGDRLAHLASPSFDAATFELWGALLNGGTVVIIDRDTALSSAAFAANLRARHVSSLFVTTALFNRLVQDVPDIFASVRDVLFGGEAADPQAVRAVLGNGAPQRLLHVYGPTEATTFSTWLETRAVAADARTVPIGAPIANSTCYVLDAALQPVPIGVAGELYLGGDGLAHGYWGRPALTAERFIPDPFGPPGRRLYGTGDLVRRLGDGSIAYLTRRDGQVKLRGFRIELGEIEAALRAHAGVEQAVVVAHEDAAGKRLVAYVVGRGEARPDATGLRHHLQHTLPDYMVPAGFVVLDQLPLTPNGKLDRKALPAPDWQGSSDAIAPRTPTEATLAAIWRDVLKLDRISVNDNFFALGGDSIQSIQLVARANRVGLSLSARQVFEQQTIAGLAAVAGRATAVCAEQGLVQGEVPLTPIQRWLFEQELIAPHHFNQAVLLDCDPGLTPAALGEALRHLVRHHDALRLRFHRTEQGWHQVHAEEAEPAFEQIDLSALDAAAQGAALARHADRLQASLELAAGPLVCAAWFDLGAQGRRLLLILHHLVVDGVSWRILLDDLDAAVAALQQGDAVQLAAKTTSFRQWAEQLTAYAGSAAAQRELAYWQQMPWSDAGRLPVDHPGGINTAGAVRMVSTSLSEADTRALLQEVPNVYHTQINDALLTALAEAVAAWSGRRRLLVALEGHGREALFAAADVSRTVGWFTSLFPVRLDLGGAADPGAALKAVKEQLRAVPNRGIGYGILRYLSGAKALPMPEPQISFNYLGQLDEAGGPRPFRFAGQNTGALTHPGNARRHLIDVSAHVHDGRLQLQWFYNAGRHAPETMTALAERYVAALRDLIAHCKTSAGGFTPSDFPLAATRQIELDRLVAMLGGPRQIEDIYPLSATQQGLLFHSLYAPESTVYVISLGCRLVGALDVDAFEQAWQRMVERHAVLRTAFVGQELEQPLQVVLRHAVLPFERHDWRTLDAAEQAARLAALQQAERARGFDFTRPPLLRLHLVRTAAAEYRLIWNSHHIVFDGWSMPILFNEVFAAYGALCRRETPQLKPPRPFRDYIGWLQRQDQGAAEAYWRRRLAGFATPTAFGLGRPAAPTDPVDHYAEHEGTFPVALAEIEGFARRHRLTLNTLVQGAWALLLSRYGDSTEVVFGVTVSGRPAELPEVERTVGLFINTLPLRLAVPPRQKILDWLREVQARQSELTDYQYSALADVQRSSEVPAGTPLFDSIVAFENYPAEMSALSELTRTVRITDVRPTERTNYPLTLQVTVGPTLSFRLICDIHRFEAVAVERLIGHFTHLFQQMIADPERPLSALALLSEAEHRQLVGFNDTAAEYPRGLLHELFAAQAARTPEAVALSLDEATLSYGDLERRANQLAHHLRGLGVGPDVVVGLCAERSFEMVIGLLSILKAGGAYLPLDPDYPAERLAFMLADAHVPVLLTRAAVADRLPASDATVVRLDADWPQIARHPTTAPPNACAPDNLAYVIYTSGSTGRPKGTLITHDCVTRLFAATDAWFDFGPHDVWTLFHSLAFDFSVWELWGALRNGGRLVVVPYWVSRSPDLFHALVAREGVTVLNQTPSAFAGLMQADAARPRALSLRWVIFGGEALNFAELTPWFERHGEARPQLVNMYGITETTVHVTWRPVRRSDADAAASAIGRPIPDLQAYVLDRHGDPVPLGVAGELYVGGAGLARGYLNRPGLTAERFVPSPFEAGARLYRTGDLARWRATGALDYLGRIDHQVKIRGFRIELGEIEAALLKHDAVERAAVVVNEATDRRLIAYVVGRGDARPDAAGLRHHLQQALPDYMVPAGFVVLERLPLTANGKLDRKALPAPDWHGSGDAVAPRNPTEQALAAIWRDVLKLDRISVNDNFFALGGDSIQSIQLVARANRVGLSLSARQVFEQQTIAGLAAVAGRATAVCAEQGLVQGEVPLTPIQRWLFEQELIAPHHFNQAVLLDCDPGLTPAALGEALRHLVRHHDALRLRFHRTEQGWHQAHTDEAAPAFEAIDLSALDAGAQDAALARHADRLQASLELATGPLVCAAWFDLGAQGRRLLLILHHLVVDGVSWRILLDDLDAAVAALQQGDAVQLAAKTTSFRQWAEQLTAYAKSAAAQRELAYWQQVPWSDAGQLPVDYPGGINTAGMVRMVSTSLSAADTRALLQEVPNVYHTQINDALLTALAEAVAAWSGRRRLLVALEGHGREALFAAADVSRTVGWFTSLFPVRLDLTGASDPGAALKAVKEQLRAVPNRGIGYGILRYLSGAKALPMPEPEISFNYLGQLDQAGGARPFRFAGQNVGALTHPGNARRHLIDVSAHVHDGQLQLQWVYSTAIHETSTIEAVAQNFVAQLQNLIEHCEASEGGFTPSDFPLLQANLSF